MNRIFKYKELSVNQFNYDNLLIYAQQLSKQTSNILTKSDTESEETLIWWISNNEPDYDPFDEEGHA